MIIPPGFAHARILFEADGKLNPVITTFGVRLTAGVTDPLVVADACLDAWNAGFAATELDSNWAITGCSVTIGSDGGDGPSGTLNNRTAGARASSAVTINTAILVRKQTALGGRRNRGRMYLPAGYASEGEISELGVVDSALVASLQTSATGFLTTLAGTSSVDAMVILHESTPATPTVVTSLTVQTLAATQRKRMRR